MSQIKPVKRNKVLRKGGNKKKKRAYRIRVMYNSRSGMITEIREKALRRARVPENPHPVPMPPIDDDDEDE